MTADPTPFGGGSGGGPTGPDWPKISGIAAVVAIPIAILAIVVQCATNSTPTTADISSGGTPVTNSHPAPPTSSTTPPGQELCDGPNNLRICVMKDHSGSLSYWATTNVSDDCTITIGLYDDDSDYLGPVFEPTKEPCERAQSYRPPDLGDPTTGRRYHSELAVEWSDGRVEVYKSPTLVW
ncbi:hypothetical protein [Nocardia sp. NPDC050413]|uniref:hypothetical protein n=2 Tax=Nocardia TaxID=1817 RepID=UPI0033E6CA8E